MTTEQVATASFGVPTSRAKPPVIRGGRLIKWKGRAASLSPVLGMLTGSVSSLAVVALAGGQVVLSAGGAWAGTCSETAPGSGVWNCVGMAANPGDFTQELGTATTGPLSVTTNPGLGIDVADGNAFTLRSNAGITFVDDNESSITGNAIGIY